MSQQSERSKIDAVVREMGWDKKMRRKFHQFLDRHYRGLKDDLSYRELLELARQFEARY